MPFLIMEENRKVIRLMKIICKKYLINILLILLFCGCSNNNRPSNYDENNRLRFVFTNIKNEYQIAEIFENYAFMISGGFDGSIVEYNFYNVKESKITTVNSLNEFLNLLSKIEKDEKLGFYSYCVPAFNVNMNELNLIERYCKKHKIKLYGNANYNFEQKDLKHNRILCTCE